MRCGALALALLCALPLYPEGLEPPEPGSGLQAGRSSPGRGGGRAWERPRGDAGGACGRSGRPGPGCSARRSPLGCTVSPGTAGGSAGAGRAAGSGAGPPPAAGLLRGWGGRRRGREADTRARTRADTRGHGDTHGHNPPRCPGGPAAGQPRLL